MADESKQFIELQVILTSSNNKIFLGAIRFYNKDSERLKPISVENVKGSNGWETAPTNLLDSATDIFWEDENYCSKGHSELIFKFPKPIELDSYELITSPNDPQSDPSKWKIKGKRQASLKKSSSGGINRPQWILLDKRENICPPSKRGISYGRLYLNYGKEEEKKEIESCIDNFHHLDKRNIRLFTTCEISQFWSGSRDKFCEEYEEARKLIQIHSKFMSITKIQEYIDYFDKISIKISYTFSDIIKRLISRQYNVSDSTVTFYCQEETNINYYNQIMLLYESFTWRQEYLHILLTILNTITIEIEKNRFNQEEIKQINKILDVNEILTNLAKLSNEHKIPQINYFHKLLNIIYTIHSTFYPNDGQQLHNNDDGTLHESADIFDDKISSDPDILALQNSFIVFLDDFKMKAFHSCFIEPTKFYYHLICEDENQVFAEIQCMSLYSGLLLSTLGIRVPFMPYFIDQIKFCPPFLSINNSGVRNCFKLMSSQSHIGKSWNEIYDCKCFSASGIKRLPGNLLSDDLATVVEISNQAVDFSPEHEMVRKQVSEYLIRFSKVFRRKFLSKRIFNYFKMHNKEALENSFFKMKQAKRIKEDSLDKWIFVRDNFSKKRARVLFRYIGIYE